MKRLAQGHEISVPRTEPSPPKHSPSPQIQGHPPPEPLFSLLSHCSAYPHIVPTCSSPARALEHHPAQTLPWHRQESSCTAACTHTPGDLHDSEEGEFFPQEGHTEMAGLLHQRAAGDLLEARVLNHGGALLCLGQFWYLHPSGRQGASSSVLAGRIRECRLHA